MVHDITDYIDQICRFEDLSSEQMSGAFQIMMAGEATPVQVAAFLMCLKMKGETVDEVIGAAQVMRAKSKKIIAPSGAIDTCGTGGDHSNSLNISTAVAFVVAACGVPVAKHGNRAVSSRSGSADVLAELGVNIDADMNVMQGCLNEQGLCFMMAPKFHDAMRHVAPIRQELGVRTIFNILGPLSNPADADFQLIGVYRKELIDVLIHALKGLGIKSAWVVHGSDGLDELTVTGPTYVAKLRKDGSIVHDEIDPIAVGLDIYDGDELMGGDAAFNADALKALLLDQPNKAYRDIVCLNAGACLEISGKVDDLAQGVRLAGEALTSGEANRMLVSLIERSNAAL